MLLLLVLLRHTTVTTHLARNRTDRHTAYGNGTTQIYYRRRQPIHNLISTEPGNQWPDTTATTTAAAAAARRVSKHSGNSSGPDAHSASAGSERRRQRRQAEPAAHRAQPVRARTAGAATAEGYRAEASGSAGADCGRDARRHKAGETRGRGRRGARQRQQQHQWDDSWLRERRTDACVGKRMCVGRRRTHWVARSAEAE